MSSTYHGRTSFASRISFASRLTEQVSARAFLARVLWLQGFSDQAVRTAEMSIEEAQATGHALSLCYALALAACPIALWVGNLATAAHYTGMLVDHSRKHGLPLWSVFGSRFQKAVVLMRGDIDAGSQLLDTSLGEVAQSNLSFRSFTGLSQLAEILVQAGRMAEGQAVLKGMEQFEAGFYTPELLRLKGELLSIAGHTCGRGNGEGPLQAGARCGARAWSAVMGVARGDEPRPPAARSRPPRRRHRLPPADLRSLHGGFRYRRSYRGETATG